MSNTFECKGHDFESSDENDFSEQNAELGSDEEYLPDEEDSLRNDEETHSDEEYGLRRVKRELATSPGTERDSDNDNPPHMTSYYGKGHSTGRNSNGKRQGMTLIKMPNGDRKYIKKYPMNACGQKTQLIELDHNDSEFKIIKHQIISTKVHKNFSGYNIIKLERVINGCFWNKYRRAQVKIARETDKINEHLYFHGSAKVKELLETGFDERFSSTDGMFGAGVYFASNSSKSNQYAFGLNGKCGPHSNMMCSICERKMLICRVTMGKVFRTTRAMTGQAHAPHGYHSVQGDPSHHMRGLKNPEYIVYRGEQVYPEYVITYKIEI